MPDPGKSASKKPKQPAHARKLTPAQRLFADYVIEGKPKNESYRLAYPQSNLSPGSLTTQAYRLSNLPHVAEYIAEAQAERRREVLLTRDKKRQVLGSIALNPRTPAQARIMAVHQDNLMTGDHKPQRIEGEITLGLIFRALMGTTAVPSAGEAKALEAEIVGEVQALPMPPSEQTEDDPLPVPAMEKAKLG